MRPLIRHHFVFWVRRVKKDIIVFVRFSGLDIRYLLADLQQHIAETVYLHERLALGRLNHQCSVYRERECRRMIAIVHQTFGYIRLGNTDCVELAAIKNQFVPYPSRSAGINNAVRLFEPRSHIVSRKDSRSRSMAEPLRTQHSDISP